jgi:cytochrome b561
MSDSITRSERPADLDLLVIVVGAVGLIQDSRPNSAPLILLSLHVAFGVLLWLAAIAQFRGQRHAWPALQPADIRAFARRLSRRVYLLLYGLMFFNLSLAAMRSASPGASFMPAAHFQCYLACGVFTLLSIHVLTALSLRLPISVEVGNGRLTYGEPASPKRHG